MPNLIRLLVALLLFSLGCSSAGRPPTETAHAAPASPRLLLASSSWPPFVDAEDKPRVALNIVSTALARAGFVVDNQVTTLDSVIEGLRANSYDGSAALWRSSEREQFLLYSQPFLENRLMLVGRQGSDVSATSFAELRGKRIGIVEGYAYGPELDEAKEPLFVRGASSEENLRAVLRGELDYALEDALVLHQLAQHYPQQTREKFAMAPTPLLTRSLYLTVRKDLPNAQRIVEGFNQQLNKMLSDGSYHDALHVDWIRADVDGDGKLELVAAGDRLGTEEPTSAYQVSLASAIPPEGEGGNRYVIRGVAYDSWQAVPDDLKTPSEQLGAKPAALRASVFEF